MSPIKMFYFIDYKARTKKTNQKTLIEPSILAQPPTEESLSRRGKALIAARWRGRLTPHAKSHESQLDIQQMPMDMMFLPLHLNHVVYIRKC